MVAVAWLSTATTSSQPLQVVAPGLKAGRNYLVTGWAIASNTSAAAATFRVSLTTAAAGGVVGPNQGVWLAYQANLAADQTPVGCYTDGTTASFVYSPTVDGDVTFIMYSTGTANAFTFGVPNAMISVTDISGAPGPVGPTGPSGPAGGGSIIVSARAYRSAALTLNGTDQNVVCDTENWDTQNAYNNSTGLFTCPQAGKYKITGQVVANPTAANQWIVAIIYKNGVSVTQDYLYANGSGMYIFGQVNDTLDLAVGDTIGLYARTSASLPVINNSNNTYLTIDLLSGTGPQGPPGPAGPPAGYMSLVYYQTIPRPTVASSPYTVTHNLGTTFLLVDVWDAVTNQKVSVQVQTIDNNRLGIYVSQDMPNPVNVVVMGTAQTPTPIAAGDLATKAYVDAKTTTLPAPITSGSGVQSFTDALGDVWVAANGVRGGNWYRARDVLHGSWYRSAAWNTATNSVTFIFDTVVSDPYSIYTSTSTNGIVIPITGLWHFDMGLACTVSAAAWFACSLRDPNGNFVWGAAQTGMPAFSASMFGVVSFSRMFNAGDKIVPFASASAAVAGSTGTANHLSFDYLGTG
jgi:hypothetical protein